MGEGTLALATVATVATKFRIAFPAMDLLVTLMGFNGMGLQIVT